MKVILYMAPTINGLIAKEDDSVEFVSKVSFESYRKAAAEAKNVIVGSKTYTLMQEAGDLDGLQGITVVIVSKGKNISASEPDHMVVESPQEALTFLAKQDVATAIIAGGGTLNGSFMQEGLVDELYLDIEPVALGKGIKLFGDSDFEAKLELLGTKQLSANEIQLHYRVLK